MGGQFWFRDRLPGDRAFSRVWNLWADPQIIGYVVYALERSPSIDSGLLSPRARDEWLQKFAPLNLEQAKGVGAINNRRGIFIFSNPGAAFFSFKKDMQKATTSIAQGISVAQCRHLGLIQCL